MSRSDTATGQLSSNWKKLQEKLKSEKKATDLGSGSGTKRKRDKGKKSTTGLTSNGFKKARLSGANVDAVSSGRTRKMSAYLSTNGASAKASALIHEHDIAPSDISAAYGAAAPAKRTHDDQVNGGLHQTRKIGKHVSLDCEMVGTGPPPHLDNVLARASLVNFHGEQIYDSFVQPLPSIKVDDYRTHVSGIKPHHIKPGYARPFKEVQKDVAVILEGRVLVGHALRNDLNALMLGHPKRDMRDTSRHPKFRIDSRGKPPALRNLARSELGIEIQTGEHSSVEDARTAMLLFQKEKKGFEEENRKHFGTRKVVAAKEKEKTAKQDTPDFDDGEDDERDDEDDLDLLEGEENPEILEQMTAGAHSEQAKSKKRKKKKRTKRK